MRSGCIRRPAPPDDAAIAPEGEIIDVYQAAGLKTLARKSKSSKPHPSEARLPTDRQDEATKLVLQQAELLCAEWAA